MGVLMSRIFIVIGCLLLLPLGACATKTSPVQTSAASDVKTLSAAEAKGVVSGNSVQGTNGGGTYTVFYDPNGTERGIWSKGSDVSRDTGIWTVKDDGRFCETWTKWEDAREKCWRFYHTSAGTIGWLKPDGSEDTGDTIFITGNAAQL